MADCRAERLAVVPPQDAKVPGNAGDRKAEGRRFPSRHPDAARRPWAATEGRFAAVPRNPDAAVRHCHNGSVPGPHWAEDRWSGAVHYYRAAGYRGRFDAEERPGDFRSAGLRPSGDVCRGPPVGAGPLDAVRGARSGEAFPPAPEPDADFAPAFVRPWVPAAVCPP